MATLNNSGYRISTFWLYTRPHWLLALGGLVTGWIVLTLVHNSISAQEIENKSSWIVFEKCLVVAPETISLATQESGILSTLVVQENSPVQVKQAIGQLASEAAELERQMAGLQSQVASSEANDESEIRLSEMVVEETKLQLISTEELANKGGAGRMEVRQKQIGVEQAKTRLVQSKANKLQKELKAKLAMATYNLAQKKVERLNLESPVDGIVTKVEHLPGEWVTAGTTICEIVRMDALRVDFFIDVEKIDPATLIQKPVRIQMTQFGNNKTFAGHITGYAPEVSATGKVRMHARVQNQKEHEVWALLPGMSVTLQLSPLK